MILVFLVILSKIYQFFIIKLVMNNLIKARLQEDTFTTLRRLAFAGVKKKETRQEHINMFTLKRRGLFGSSRDTIR